MVSGEEVKKVIQFFRDGGGWLILFIIAALIAGILDGCVSAVGTEMPKQKLGQTDNDYWMELKKGGWF